jgi:tetratricopeptide (TPR) repeat protein
MKMPNYILKYSLILLATSLTACSVNEPKPQAPNIEPMEVPPPKPIYRPKTDPYKENRATQVEQLEEKTRLIEQEAIDAEKERLAQAETEALDPYKKEQTPNTQEAKPEEQVEDDDTASAVTSLMLRSRVDVVAGRYDQAIEKLERGLRIAPDNPDLWNKLADVHYLQEHDDQVISMAEKSLRLTPDSNTQLQRRNWKLIAKANKRRGNMEGMKEAMRKLAEL